jgi:hypothetical protein
MTITPDLAAIGRAFTQQFAPWNITLSATALAQQTSGSIAAYGWHIHYLFGADERGLYLDYYASHRMTNDRHLRLYTDGTTLDLPAILEAYVYAADATEAQKRQAEQEYYAHNQRVLAELRRKGFA